MRGNVLQFPKRTTIKVVEKRVYVPGLTFDQVCALLSAIDGAQEGAADMPTTATSDAYREGVRAAMAAASTFLMTTKRETP